jgi:hypothetical protein
MSEDKIRERMVERQSFFERVAKECLEPDMIGHVRSDIGHQLFQIAFPATVTAIIEHEYLMQETNSQLKELVIARILSLKEHIDHRFSLALSRLEKYEDKQ